MEKTIQEAIDQKTKPLGSLGLLEHVALRIGLIQQTVHPKIESPHIVVFAADHGIAATGLVNPYPQAVTAQMLQNFVRGGAAINVFCRLHDISLWVVDAGVNAVLEPSPLLIDQKIGMGTQDYRIGFAMTEEEARAAIVKGRTIVQQVADRGCNTIGFGEMGIGNSSSAALIMHHLLHMPITDCTGRGTGVDDVQLQTKIETLEQVSQWHALSNQTHTVEELLQRVGGFEIAMMTGAYLQAAELGMVVVVDGFISTAALLLAHAMAPTVLNNCIFAHASGEKGHAAMLDYLQAKPLLQLQMRLGEGTGAALAIPLIRSAVAMLNEMASFESAGISSASSGN